MTKSNKEIQLNCFLIEAMIKKLVLEGNTDIKLLVDYIGLYFNPTNEWEMEIYSEAIIFAKYSILN